MVPWYKKVDNRDSIGAANLLTFSPLGDPATFVDGRDREPPPPLPDTLPELPPRNLHVGNQAGEAAVHAELSDPVVDLREPGRIGPEPGERCEA